MRVAWRALRPGELDHERLWLVVGVLVVAVGAVVAAGWVPLRLACPFKLASGWPCPTCGSTRAWMALATGRFQEALRLNPLTTIAALAWGAWTFHAALVVLTGRPRLRLEWSIRDLGVLRWCSATALLACWVFLVLDGR